MKRKTAALYDPYLDVMGGGERHALSILKVLAEENFQPVIFWNKDIANELTSKLNLSFKSPLQFEKNIFIDPEISIIKKMQKLSQLDILIYMTDGSYFFSTAKKTVIFALVPDKKLFSMTAANKLKTMNATFVTNSEFTKHHLSTWGINAKVLYPYLDSEVLKVEISKLQKQKIILSVGRFFTHLHAKRQDIMIEFFKKLKQELSLLKDYKLILSGGLKEEDRDYFHQLEEMIGDDSSIELRPNISYENLQKLYKESEIYWHFAGYGVDENQEPHHTEHLGITPLEAMAYGDVVFCFKAGGLKETIQDGKTGYLFITYDELKEKMQKFLAEKDHSSLQNNAKEYLRVTFSYECFKQNVKDIFLT